MRVFLHIVRATLGTLTVSSLFAAPVSGGGNSLRSAGLTGGAGVASDGTFSLTAVVGHGIVGASGSATFSLTGGLLAGAGNMGAAQFTVDGGMVSVPTGAAGPTLAVSTDSNGGTVLLASTAASGAGTTLLTIGAQTAVTAGSAGAAAMVQSDGLGGIALVVSKGSVQLPVAAWVASPATHCATQQQGTLYAGETAYFNTQGQVKAVVLGDGLTAAAGDPLSLPAAGNVSFLFQTPQLSAAAARLGLDTSLGQKLQSAMTTALPAGAQVKLAGPNASWQVSFSGQTFWLVPQYPILVEPNVADGFITSITGDLQFATCGVVTDFAPTLFDPVDLGRGLQAMDPAAKLSLKANGRVEASLDGTTWLIEPEWSVSNIPSTATMLGSDGAFLTYQSGGLKQWMAPASADPVMLLATARTLDPNAVLSSGNGSITLTLRGIPYVLYPDWQVITTPAAHAKDAYWADASSGMLFIKLGDGRAQGFRVGN